MDIAQDFVLEANRSGIPIHLVTFADGVLTGTIALREEAIWKLPPREWEILELLAQGLTNTAIAEKLVLNPKTIRNQVSSIFSKLQVASRSQAIVKAREAGLGKAES